MSTLVKFWKHAIAEGRTPAAVWATVSLGGQQPEGYVAGWSVSKRSALADLVKRGDAGNWILVQMLPWPTNAS